MGDDYGSKFSDIFGHLPKTTRCFEDLVYSRKYKEHFTLVRDVPLKKDILSRQTQPFLRDTKYLLTDFNPIWSWH
jgi:hypothetical protein